MYLTRASLLFGMASLAVASPALPATICALSLKTGVTTTTFDGGKAPATTTIYPNAVGDGVFINCNSYTSVTATTIYTGTPTATVTNYNAIPTTAWYECNPTLVCPTTTSSPTCRPSTLHPGTLTSTVTSRGDGISTIYASTFSDGVEVNCSGYTAISVKTTYEPLNHKTVHSAGMVTRASYFCQPTLVCSPPGGIP